VFIRENLRLTFSFRDQRDLRSAKDITEDASEAAIIPAVVAVVVVTIILAKSLRIAPHKSISKLLRASVLVVVRTLRVIALAAASITRPSVQAGLVSLVQLNLGAVVVATIVPVTTIAIVAVIAIISIITATAIPVVVAIPSPISILSLTTIAITTMPLKKDGIRRKHGQYSCPRAKGVC
jgi:hypothetical protein